MAAVVSIIIPFYNEELYLKRAINSVVQQSYKHTEIILVNDGSTDRSLQIAEEYLKAYPSLKIISTTNKGLGHARNAGMAAVSGQYIAFLDSDDELNKDALTIWVDKIEKEQADIVISKFSMINPNSEAGNMITGWKGSGSTITYLEAAKAMYEYKMSSTAWAKLYRSSITRQLRFPEGLWFEDRPFLLSYFLSASKVAFDAHSGLNILSRPGSITRSLMSERRIKDAFRIYLLELDIVSAHIEHKELTRLIDRHQINAMVEALILLYFDRKNHPALKEIKSCFSTYVNAFVLQLHKNGTKIGLRDWADLILIRLHRFAGWPLMFLILPFWKRKKCKSVLFLKSF